MFDDPQPGDTVQGKNGVCTVAQFNAMTEAERQVFTYGPKLYVLEWVEGKHDNVSVTLCGVFTSAEKRQAAKEKLAVVRNSANNLAFDPSYYEGEWVESEYAPDEILVTSSHTDWMGAK